MMNQDHWGEKPVVHASVLLLDGKIVNWKVGKKVWRTVMGAFWSRQFIWLMEVDGDRLSVDYLSFPCDTSEEISEVFEIKAPKFLSRYKFHEKYSGHKL